MRLALSILLAGVSVSTGLLVAAENSDTPDVHVFKRVPFLPEEVQFEKLKDPFTFRYREGHGPRPIICFGHPGETAAKQCYGKARAEFDAGNYTASAQHCAEGVQQLKTEAEPLVRSEGFNPALMQRLTGLQHAAQRQAERQAAQADVEKLALEPVGVIRNHQALALLKTSAAASGTAQTDTLVLKQGQSLPGSEFTKMPVIWEISKERMILTHRGYKLEVPLRETGL